jgi:chorismate mutase
LSTRAVRGAIRVGENAAQCIQDTAVRLVREVLASNRIAENQLVSIIFSLTEDLTASNPATGLRSVGFAATPLFCVNEARVDGGMPRVLRVLVTWNSISRRPAVPVYLDGAEALRPDLGPGDNA